jgi:hypothetical protein
MRQLTPVVGAPVALPDPERLVHLQFRRFAGCPVCNLHIRTLLRRHDEIEAAGIREVLIFYSAADELRGHVADLPVAVIADPAKRLYVEFGVVSSPRALLDPRAWLPILRAATRSAAAIARGRERPFRFNPDGGRLGLPAEFLIAPDGAIVAGKYGTHIYDQWSVDELLGHAERPRAAGPVGTAPKIVW